MPDVAKASGGSRCWGCTGSVCAPEQEEFSSEKLLMQMYKVTIQRKSLGCTWGGLFTTKPFYLLLAEICSTPSVA